jgi:hypothetical protein
MAKYYRTTFFVEVLSTEPLPDTVAVSDLGTGCIKAQHVLRVDRDLNQEVDGKLMAILLRNQGREAKELGLHDNGDPIT